MQVVLFLGAGVSVPSGLPTAVELTERLFNEPWHDDGKGVFAPGVDRRPNSSDTTSRVVELLRLIQAFDVEDIQRVGLSPGPKGFTSSGAIYRGASTYEDLFFLSQQISLWNMGLSDNSLTTPFMECIERKAEGLLRGSSVEARLCDLATLGQQAVIFVESVVAATLRRPYVAGLDLVGELATAPEIDRLDIVTLNHDTLLEQYLDAHNIHFMDGFGDPDGDVRWNDNSRRDAATLRVRVLKLHGAVNWYSFIREGRPQTAILLGPGASSSKDANGASLTPLFRRPSFLSGVNKSTSYQRGIYSEIHFRFSETLRQSNRMIMSGYGWGDTAISFQLESWLDTRRTNRIILLQQNSPALTNRSLILASGHDSWVESGQLICIEKWLSDAILQEIAPHLR